MRIMVSHGSRLYRFCCRFFYAPEILLESLFGEKPWEAPKRINGCNLLWRTPYSLSVLAFFIGSLIICVVFAVAVILVIYLSGIAAIPFGFYPKSYRNWDLAVWGKFKRWPRFLTWFSQRWLPAACVSLLVASFWFVPLITSFVGREIVPFFQEEREFFYWYFLIAAPIMCIPCLIFFLCRPYLGVFKKYLKTCLQHIRCPVVIEFVGGEKDCSEPEGD